VLVVDDDPSIRLVCRVNLELDGWEVDEAASVEEARARLAGGNVQIVLLDVQLGEESGVDLLHDIRRAHPRVRVAMFTGSADSLAFDGADAVITKPFTLDQLHETVLALAG
jgi:DNA-binding NtrC family response regulator